MGRESKAKKAGGSKTRPASRGDRPAGEKASGARAAAEAHTAPKEHIAPYPWLRVRAGGGAAFIYRKMVGQVDPAARSGDIVAVYDRGDALVGHGFWHERSQIAVRMLTNQREPVDEAFFRERLSLAVRWRERLFGAIATNAECGMRNAKSGEESHEATKPRSHEGDERASLRSPEILRQAQDDSTGGDERDAGCEGKGGLRFASPTLHKALHPEREETNVYRLVHAEGDGISGLVAERYDDWIAIEVFSLGVYQRLGMLKRMLGEQTGIHKFIVRADERVERLEGFAVRPGDSDEGPRTLIVRENVVRFRVDPRGGHKTGFFCDQRENRARLARLVRGADDVLDVCCYSGGFGIYAKKLGGAASVTGVDLDEEAIELARQNANLNQVRVQYVHADAFAYMRQMRTNGRTFDVVVLDPPKFVAAREEYDEGMRKYADLNAGGVMLVRPGGLLLTCSCSGLVSREEFGRVVAGAAQRAGRGMQIVMETGAGPDHPVMAGVPESGYLKAVFARVL